MRKSIKSKSKRKWIVGGFAFFGGLALLTTGFAAWVFGINQNMSGSDVTLGTDTAINDTVFLDLKVGADNKVVLAESQPHEVKGPGEIAATQTNQGVDAITFDETGMQIDVSYTVVWGKDKGMPTKINFTLPKTSDNTQLPEGVELKNYVNDSIVTTATNIEYEKASRTGLTYFEAPYAIDIAADAKKEMESNKNASSFTLEKTLKVTFKWGSFFNNVSPLNYYNTLSKALYAKIGPDYSAKQYLNEASILSQQATTELNAMKKIFDGKKVYLLATLAQQA